MAGSKRWFSYQLDDGTNGGVFLDESNTETINGGASNTPLAGAPTRQVPKGTRLRAIYYKSTDGNRTLKIYALNQTIYSAIPANLRTIADPLTPGQNLVFDRKRPEITRAPAFGIDTGLTDGDNP